MTLRVVVLLVLCGTAAAQSQPQASGTQGKPPDVHAGSGAILQRAAVEDDIREAAVRYVRNAYRAHASTVFLYVNRDTSDAFNFRAASDSTYYDPPRELLARLNGRHLPVQPMSVYWAWWSGWIGRYHMEPKEIRDPKTGSPAALVTLHPVEWLAANRVHVFMSVCVARQEDEIFGPLVVEQQNGRWAVTYFAGLPGKRRVWPADRSEAETLVEEAAVRDIYTAEDHPAALFLSVIEKERTEARDAPRALVALLRLHGLPARPKSASKYVQQGGRPGIYKDRFTGAQGIDVSIGPLRWVFPDEAYIHVDIERGFNNARWGTLDVLHKGGAWVVKGWIGPQAMT